MDKVWWGDVGMKVVETIISVKVLTIAAIITITTFMVYDGKMSGETFATFNGAIITTVYALREGFKIANVRSSKEDGENGDHKRKMMV